MYKVVLWWLWRLTPFNMLALTMWAVSSIPRHHFDSFLLGVGVTLVNLLLLLLWLMGRFSPEEVAHFLTSDG